MLTDTMFPLAVQLAKDRVPNVRFNAAQTLRRIMPHLGAGGAQASVTAKWEPH